METSKTFNVMRTNGADESGHTHVCVSVSFFKSYKRIYLCLNDEKHGDWDNWIITMLGAHDIKPIPIRNMERFNQKRFNAICDHVGKVTDTIVKLYCERSYTEREQALREFVRKEFGDVYGNL